MRNQEDPERTFQYQDSLPALPVPSLDSTLSKYLDAVRPFASDEAYRSAVATVRRFREGVGERLHQKLLHRARRERNWIIHQALTGDPTIRWGDKSYNSICFANGTFGCNCDHAPYDGMVMVSLYDYIDKQLKVSHGVWTGTDTVRSMSFPEELVFTVDDAVRRDISHAKRLYLDTSQDLQVVCYAFTSLGRAAITQRRLHPDTFIQLAMQLAYYTMHGRPGSCYETAMTRRFYHGRTETMRPCTVEAVAWCRSMLESSCTMDSRRRALLLAVNKHNRLMSEARNGLGFDRHLLGLSLIAREEGLPVPDLFLDPLYAQSGGGNFVLSSSPVGHTTVLGAGAPMVHGGYGVFYRITDDRVVASVTAWKAHPQTDAERFYRHLCTSLQDLLHLATTSPL